MYSNLISSLKTTADLNVLNSEIDILIDSLFENKIETFEEVINKNVRKIVADEIKRELETEKIKKEDYLNGLKVALKDLKILKITLAFEPSQDQVSEICSFLEAKGKNLVLEIDVNQKIIAGAVISYGGEYRDFSVSNQLDKILKDQRSGKLTKGEVFSGA